MNDIEELLNKTDEIAKKHQIIAEATGRKFNIFEVTNIHTDEVRLCRILTELLDTEGSHCQGRVYLNLFFEKVLRIDTPQEPINVRREDVIEGSRRIDIVIKDATRKIPIEVKINAGDQDRQLCDYAKESRGIEKPKVYYLTKFGDKPSKDSCGDLAKDDIGCISWENDILEWLKACISYQGTIIRPPICEILLQFASAIRKFTEQLQEDEQVEIEELLNTPEMIMLAEKIEPAVLSKKRKLAEQFRAALKDKLKEYKELDYDKDWNTNSDATYGWKLGYLLEKNIGEDKDYIRVAIVSYVNQKLSFQTYKATASKWDSPIGESEKVIEFSIYNLLDNVKLNDEVNKCVDELKSLCHKMT